MQQPVSTFLRQRYESIDTTVTITDYSLGGSTLAAALNPTAPSRAETPNDFTLTLSDDFDMREFMSASLIGSEESSSSGSGENFGHF